MFDQDKVPEGATHYVESRTTGMDAFYRLDGGPTMTWAQATGVWSESAFKTNDMAIAMFGDRLKEIPMKKEESDLDWLARNVHEWPKVESGTRGNDVTWAMNRGEIVAVFTRYPRAAATKDEWLARRDELRGKPVWKDAPWWAAWLSQDGRDGVWFWLEIKPNSHGGEINAWNIDESGAYAWAGSGMVLGDWRDTLESRPADLAEHAQDEKSKLDPVSATEANALAGKLISQLKSDALGFDSNTLSDLDQLCDAALTKRDASVCGGEKHIDASWFERGELPPVGTECEFWGGAGDNNGPWHADLMDGDRVTVIAHFECGICTLAAFTFKSRNPNLPTILVEQANYGCFRPIQTERQRTITGIVDIMIGTPANENMTATERLSVVAGAIYDKYLSKQGGKK